MKSNSDTQVPILFLTVQQIQALLMRTSRLPDDCEVALGFMVGDSGVGLYAWPVRHGSVWAEPLFSKEPANGPEAPGQEC